MSNTTPITTPTVQVNGGPLQEEPEQVHSLRVYMRGDGMTNRGFYHVSAHEDGSLFLAWNYIDARR